MQLALQCRHDDATILTPPARVRNIALDVARSGVASLLDWSEESWTEQFVALRVSHLSSRGLIIYARRRVEELLHGGSWQREYPRDVWRLRLLGLHERGVARVRFDGIAQPWLRELAKRSARWRLSTGISATHTSRSVNVVARFLAQPHVGVGALGDIDRALLGATSPISPRRATTRAGTPSTSGSSASSSRPSASTAGTTRCRPPRCSSARTTPRAPARCRARVRARDGPGRAPGQPRPVARQGRSAGTPISFDAVAREAGVSRSWLYSQPDLRDEISRLRQRRPTALVPERQRCSDASLRQRLELAGLRIRGLEADNTRLREALAQALGDHRAVDRRHRQAG